MLSNMICGVESIFSISYIVIAKTHGRITCIDLWVLEDGRIEFEAIHTFISAESTFSEGVDMAREGFFFRVGIDG